MEVIHDNLRIIKEVEEKEGKLWIDLIYQKNGMKKPGRRRKSG